MADFVQIMKDWRKMCRAMRSCDECPMNEVKCWAKSPSDLIDSFERRQSVITEWAAEHPELKYPTWIEWLVDQGLMFVTSNTYAFNFLKATDPIPDDIAQKLGVEPKEG